MVISLTLAIDSIVESRWEGGELVKPMNHNPDLIDDLPNSFKDMTLGDYHIGNYNRGLFYKCEIAR